MHDAIMACFGDNGLHNMGLSKSNRINQNIAASIYQTKIAGHCRLVTITWSKNVMMGHCLQVNVDDPSFHITCKVEMRPWRFWMKQGWKSFATEGHKVEIHWDLSAAKYAIGPEPQEGYYVAMVCDKEVVLLLGDMSNEALKKSKAIPSNIEATLLSRREYLLGKKLFTTKAQIGDGGRMHELMIEFQTASDGEPRLCIRVDRKIAVQVKRLMWKFRGNQTILVDGVQVEVFWDVHNWLFSCTGEAHAIFMFQTCLANEKPWLKDITACRSIKEWKAPCTSTDKEPAGFALVLYASKTP
ncbi:hypothetical protein O6H91_10G109600 [Diphasiastrum complanatum]|uniref:Uncharacterized protein n=1 Tax=Diphasiastrum complanatum TaxID=34168 RepID=A0ACC2CKK5_DIPCM|nr:hypothetical protein O6H91_Y265900 [Diphasiastrum complanatum]KAJ7542519.1 hypothetical protein O6H91_10G109600 [Diphasiastrum complanatum]